MQRRSRALVLLIALFSFLGLSAISSSSVHAYAIWCRPPAGSHFVFNTGGLGYLQALANRSLSQWNGIANVNVSGSSSEGIPVLLNEGIAYTALTTGCGTDAIKIEIKPSMIKTIARFIAIVAHEVGHVLGLQHSQVQESLMWYRVSSITGPRADDMDGLRDIYPLPSESPGCPSFYGIHPTVQYGSQGSCVEHLQTLLNRYGYSLIVDGIVGVKTRDALVDYQKRFGLPQDGIASPSVWISLHTHLS